MAPASTVGAYVSTQRVYLGGSGFGASSCLWPPFRCASQQQDMHIAWPMGAADVLRLDIGGAAGAGDQGQKARLRRIRAAQSWPDVLDMGEDIMFAGNSDMMQRQEIQQGRCVRARSKDKRS